MQPIPSTAAASAPPAFLQPEGTSSFIGVGEAYERYRMEGRTDILALLRSLATDRVLIGLSADGGDTLMLSRTLAVDAAADALVIEPASRPGENSRLIESPCVLVDASHQGVRISFETGPAIAALHEGRSALRLPLPHTVLRLQRRSDYRARTPVLAAARLCLIQPSAAAPWYRVADISCGGLALVVPIAPPGPHAAARLFGSPSFSGRSGPAAMPAADAASPFVPGMRHEDATLEIPSSATLKIDLEVRHTADYRDGMGRAMRRVGCRFLHLRGADATALQRYINLIEMGKRRHLHQR